MNNQKLPLEIRAVSKSEALSKREIIRKISNATDLKQYVVEDVLNAFTDLFELEVLTTGAWAWPRMPVVERKLKKVTNRPNPKTEKLTEYPETCYLSAKIPASLKSNHRAIFRELNNIKNGTTSENWFEGREIEKDGED